MIWIIFIYGDFYQQGEQKRKRGQVIAPFWNYDFKIVIGILRQEPYPWLLFVQLDL
jgi:hypothetical protein